MEKSGRIVLTPEDLAEFRKGLVSERIQTTWGLTFAELSEIIASQNTNSNGESE
jgi:hypothetical protein